MKQKHTISLVALSILLVTPAMAFAGGLPYAGSDAYLKNSEEANKPSTIAPLEQRKPLDLSVGETTLLDPLGDVLNRMGESSNINASWGDIKSVTFNKNVELNSWQMTIGVGSVIPQTPPVGTIFSAQIDQDSNNINNDQNAGERQNIDNLYQVSFTESGWNTSWEHYENNVWTKKDTAATSSIENDQVVIRIPFEELDKTSEPTWRAFVSIDKNGETQIDAAPSVGLPEILPTSTESNISDNNSTETNNSTEETEDIKLGPQQMAALVLIVGAVIVLGISLWRVQKKEDKT